MRNSLSWRRPLAIATVLLLGVAGMAAAQVQTGNLYAKVTDENGSPLPGVAVTLSGLGAPQTMTTNAQGEARFLSLSPGFYNLAAFLDGFSPVEQPNVNIRVGLNTQLELTLSGAIEETIIVTAESPLLDERVVRSGATVTQIELEKIPTARDPWSILQQVPGVLVDRINVGGAEAGEQSNFASAGASRTSAEWAMDGVTITDPAATGASPTYFEFDSFEEMQFSTGGSDITAMTGGVQLNMVTKRGTNEWRGSARYLLTDDDYQSSASISSGDFGSAGPWNNGNAQSSFGRSNEVRSVQDYGGDIGGPIVRDRLWGWGTWGKVDVEKFAIGGGGVLIPDNTFLKTYAGKLNWQIAPSTSAVGLFHEGDKIKFGRNAGPTRPEPTTWNQTGPSPLWKAEVTQIFGSNLFGSILYSDVDGGFQLAPKAGLNTPDVVDDAGGVRHHSWILYQTERPTSLAKADGSYFFNTGELGHELKFGVGYRENEVWSRTSFPGSGLWGRKNFGNQCPDEAEPCFLGLILHDVIVNDEFEQTTLYVQDVLTAGRATFNLGLRYDLQEGKSLEFTQPASQFDPTLIPSVTRPARDPGFEWETVSPRAGVTYALGEERKTLLRASYSQFADHLSTGRFNSIGPSVYRTGYFDWRDFNNNNIIEPGEIDVFFVTDPVDVNFVANSVDPNFKPERTDEITFGVDHALRPEFVINAGVNYRRISDLNLDYPKVVEDGVVRPHRRGDYVQVDTIVGTLPNGQNFASPIYALRDGVTRDGSNGFHRANSDIEIESLGFNVGFTKRLANRWMARGYFSYGKADWDVPDHELIDPTRAINISQLAAGGPSQAAIDGGPAFVASAGSGNRGEVWLYSNWSANVSGLYQVAPDRPWGFNLGADINAREGYPIPYRVSVGGTHPVTGDRFNRVVLATPDADSFRNDDIYMINARVEKEFTFNQFGLTLGVDAFNLANNNKVLQREGLITGQTTDLRTADGDPVTIAATRGDHIRETVIPRVFRVGARISWN